MQFFPSHSIPISVYILCLYFVIIRRNEIKSTDEQSKPTKQIFEASLYTKSFFAKEEREDSEIKRLKMYGLAFSSLYVYEDKLIILEKWLSKKQFQFNYYYM